MNKGKFKVESKLYDNGEFSIVYGIKSDGIKCLSMRWNGNEDWAGYPNSYGYPAWFNIDNKLAIPILKSLLNEQRSDSKAIIQVLNELVK